MNILYCGDQNIERGMLISVLSLLKNVPEPLHIYVITMSAEWNGKQYEPVADEMLEFLRKRIRFTNPDGSIEKFDVTEAFKKEMPSVNMETRFTPYCMLRLFADQIETLPDRILYLDNDVVCRQNCLSFYEEDLDGYELAGVLDYYGKWFYHNHFLKFDYMNSGVLLLNMKKIRETGLFSKCRKMCQEEKMFLPDQAAINKLVTSKKILPRKYNEQRRLKDDTVIQHFTTTFRLFPWFHTVTVKPWNVTGLHRVLKNFAYDDILNEYACLMNYKQEKKVKGDYDEKQYDTNIFFN